jgi:hypothetical protein
MKRLAVFSALLLMVLFIAGCEHLPQAPAVFEQNKLEEEAPDLEDVLWDDEDASLAKVAAADAKNFVAILNGKQEVPSVDTRGHGLAIFRLNDAETELKVSLYVFNRPVGVGVDFLSATQAHIHLAPRSVNGPVVAFLFGPVSPGVNGNGLLAEGTLTSANLVGPLAGKTIADLANEIRNHNTYANVHNAAHPAGEIRGQLRDADGDERTLFTADVDLSGGADEVEESFVDRNGVSHFHDAHFLDRPVTGDITGTASVRAHLHFDAVGNGSAKGKVTITTAEGFWSGRFNGQSIGANTSGRFNLEGGGGLSETKLKGIFLEHAPTAENPDSNIFTLIGFIKDDR